MPHTKYCTFWYPTIFHKQLTCPTHRTRITARISDGAEEPFDLDLQLCKNGNIHVGCQLSESNFTVELKLKNVNFDGFAQYEFSTENIPCYDKFATILVKDVYHNAKSFYHIHESDPGKDGALRGIITDSQINLESDDNEALFECLSMFEQIFRGYAHNISSVNIRLIEKEEDSTLSSETKYNILLRGSIAINNLCENASIEYTYYKTLVNSIYNKTFHHNLHIDSTLPSASYEKMYSAKRKALNIRNAVRYIENIKYKNSNRITSLERYVTDTINRSNKLSGTLAWWSVAISVLSFSSLVANIPNVVRIILGVVAVCICLGFCIAFLKMKKQLKQD